MKVVRGKVARPLDSLTVDGGMGLGGPAKIRHREEEDEAQSSAYADTVGLEQALEMKINRNQCEIDNLLDKTATMKMSFSPYSFVRNRFLSQYKRDKLGKVTGTDARIIDACDIEAFSECAFRGDVVFDAGLYTGKGRRRDVSTYENLYGLDPMRVASI
ncbi:hypothetical protein FN846DRAFT_904564 [Sphaerosporella brunnea]|uniref:Uncharacterized protein n=1 Tax=Sphaerosporella brunnea TaxID=1250544 RepID=A0A5J5F4L1_9PEZI|nr:hypothetical protein FN846DRAFT_904564 [Sphaerosporella brunnea]